MTNMPARLLFIALAISAVLWLLLGISAVLWLLLGLGVWAIWWK